MVRVLLERRFPVSRLGLFATARSAGKRMAAGGEEIEIEETSAQAVREQDIVLFAGGDDASREYAWTVAAAGGVAVDNSSTWRMDPRVPLVIPEVNGHTLRSHQGVVANPNCTAAVLVMALHPLHKAAGVRRAVVATYQSVSGGGAENMRVLLEQTRALLADPDAVQAGDLDRIEALTGTRNPLAFNVLPQWKWGQDGYTEEELKIVAETHKIMEADFPILPASPGVEVVDAPEEGRFPTPLQAAGRDPVYVGRIRPDPFSPTGLLFVAVGDNLRKGAALNAVQIAEALVEQHL